MRSAFVTLFCAIGLVVSGGIGTPADLGIYEIDGDTLKACFDPRGKKRQTEFESAPGSENFVNVHKRVKK